MPVLWTPFRSPRWWLCLTAGCGAGLVSGAYVSGFAGEADALVLSLHLLFWVVLAYPLLEEIVFRGALQGWLRARLSQAWGPISLANVLTSLAFALTHVLVWGHTAAAVVFVPSLAFGWTRDAHGSVVGAVVMHALWNAAFLLGRAWA